MSLRRFIRVALVASAAACSDSISPVVPLAGEFVLTHENGKSLPSDPFPPNGCCLTVGGGLTFTDSTYALTITYQDKVGTFGFINSESGRYVRSVNTITFTRTGGSGLNLPFELQPAVVSSDGATLTGRYGVDPTLNVRTTFKRCDSCD